mgnify:CR=1 FL=1
MEHGQLLRLLRDDCRITYTDVARRLGWPFTTASERVKQCIAKYVVRCTALLDFRALCLAHHTLWVVKPRPRMRSAWLQQTKKLVQVNILSRLPSGCFFVETVTHDDNEQTWLKERLADGAVHLQQHGVCDELMRETLLASAGSVPDKTTAAGYLPATSRLSP